MSLIRIDLGDIGYEVKLIQSLLKRIGYNIEKVDGIFGIETKEIIKKFQKDHKLMIDGIVGKNTRRLIDNYIQGYDEYIIRPGDTLFIVAQKYHTSIEAIITANPYINLNNLRISQEIIVPYGIDLVFTDIDYTYDIMEKNLQGLKMRYPFLEVGLIGRSVLGKNLYYTRLGKGGKEIFYNAAHHSLEWITSVLLMKFIEEYSKAYANSSNYYGKDINKLFNEYSIYIVTMVNPDGVDLVLKGLQGDNSYYNELIRWNDTGMPFSKVWQANIRGVDLNRNYPASWGEGKAQEPNLGISGPGPTRFGGTYPLSEPETQAIAEFTRVHNFKIVIAYHTQGRVIFWRYLNMNPPKSLEIGKKLAEVTGYSLSEVYPEAAYAGYKDWFIETYNRPGYTIEVGIGNNPLSIEQFDTIYKNNIDVLFLSHLL